MSVAGYILIIWRGTTQTSWFWSLWYLRYRMVGYSLTDLLNSADLWMIYVMKSCKDFNADSIYSPENGNETANLRSWLNNLTFVGSSHILKIHFFSLFACPKKVADWFRVCLSSYQLFINYSYNRVLYESALSLFFLFSMLQLWLLFGHLSKYGIWYVITQCLYLI
jgi:hypothetical protein